MHVSEKARNNLPRIYVKDLKPNEFKLEPSQSFHADEFKYILYRS